MKRILLMVFRNILLVPFMWIKLCYMAARPDKFTDEQHRKMLWFITERANKGGNVVMEAHGLENIPKENGFIMFPNHQGMYDMLAIINVVKCPLSTVFKKEVENVPFIKQVASCMGAYALDRSNVRHGMEVILNISKDVKKGKNFVIFPEGTRSKDGNTVHEFKGGSFKAATKAKCPIIPVALIDSFKPFDTNSIKPVTVQVHFLEPMYYEDYKDMKTTEIAELVKDKIQDKINENIR